MNEILILWDLQSNIFWLSKYFTVWQLIWTWGCILNWSLTTSVNIPFFLDLIHYTIYSTFCSKLPWYPSCQNGCLANTKYDLHTHTHMRTRYPKCVCVCVCVCLGKGLFYHAGCAPNVCWSAIAGSDQHLKRTVLASLDVICEMFVL